jgi:hypothetical protein
MGEGTEIALHQAVCIPFFKGEGINLAGIICKPAFLQQLDFLTKRVLAHGTTGTNQEQDGEYAE